MGYPLMVHDLRDIGSLFVVKDNPQGPKKSTGPQISQPKEDIENSVSPLSKSVKDAKEKGRVKYMHRSKAATQDVLEGKEFVSSWVKGVSLARVVQATGKKCFVSDGQETFPILTEKNEHLSEPMQLFVDQVQPDRYIPVRFGMSNAGNKKATRDEDFCELVAGCFNDQTPQIYDGKEYYDGFTVGYDAQMNPLVYSSFDRQIHIVKGATFGEDLYGHFMLFDYSSADGVQVLKHTPETNALREQQLRAFAQQNNANNEAKESGLIQDETATTKEVVMPKKPSTQETGVKNKNIQTKTKPQDQQIAKSKENGYHKKDTQKLEQMFNEEFPDLLKITTLQNKSQNIAEVLLAMHPKGQSTSAQYRLDSLTLSYLHQHTPLTSSTATPGTQVRSKNGVAGVIVRNINPDTNKPFNKKTPGMVKVQYFRKDPSSGKERSIACMTKVEHLYAVNSSKKSIPAAQPRGHRDTKGQ